MRYALPCFAALFLCACSAGDGKEDAPQGDATGEISSGDDSGSSAGDHPSMPGGEAAGIDDAEESQDIATGPDAPREVPVRFRATYALDPGACRGDHEYAPSFQAVTVGRDRVNFFETGGPVTHVAVDGDAIAITLRETVGPAEHTRAIYLALNGDGTVRYRPGEGEDVRRYVTCGEQNAAQ